MIFCVIVWGYKSAVNTAVNVAISAMRLCFLPYIRYRRIIEITLQTRIKEAYIMFGNPPNIKKLIEKKDIRGLSKALMSDKKPYSWDIAREEALAGLVTFAKTDDQALEALIEALHHPMENIKRNVIFKLGDFPDPRSVDALITVLNDTDYYMRLYVIRALAKIGKPSQKAVPKLLAMLENDQPASIALGAIGDPRAIEPIIAHTTRVIPFVVREGTKIRQLDDLLYAIDALGNLQSAQACAVIINAYEKLDDVYAEAKRRAIEYSPIEKPARNQTIWDTYSATSSAMSAPTPWDVVNQLVSAKGRVFDALKKISLTESAPIASLTAVLESEQTRSTLEIDLELRQHIAHMLMSQVSRLNAKQRWLVAIFTEDKSLLNQLRDDTSELVALLSAQSSQITQFASKTLEKLGGEGDESQQAILAVARHDWATAESLGAVAVEPLIEKLSYPNHNVVLEVVQTLAKIGDSRAIAPIAKKLDDYYNADRNPYLLALHQLGWKPTNEADKLRSACLRYDWDELVAMGAKAVYSLYSLLPNMEHSPNILDTITAILRADSASVDENMLRTLKRMATFKAERVYRVYDGDTPYYNDVEQIETLYQECDTVRALALDELKKRGISVD
jgi:HEAT repeat protein